MAFRKDATDYHRFGHSKLRSYILAFWDLPLMVRLFG